MSKYSRTRKAICRISHLSHWIVNREYFKKNPSKTWKQSFHEFKKNIRNFDNCSNIKTEYPNMYGVYKPIPNKYKDFIHNFTIWNIIR